MRRRTLSPPPHIQTSVHAQAQYVTRTRTHKHTPPGEVMSFLIMTGCWLDSMKYLTEPRHVLVTIRVAVVLGSPMCTPASISA